MRNIMPALLLAVLLLGCASQAAPEAGEEKPVPEPVVETPEETPEPAPPPVVSLEELAMHSTVFDCWVLYKGNVYDITAFLPNHANNSIEGIVPYCGLTDDSFANAFEGQHGTSKASVLESEGVFKGVLEQE